MALLWPHTPTVPTEWRPAGAAGERLRFRNLAALLAIVALSACGGGSGKAVPSSSEEAGAAVSILQPEPSASASASASAQAKALINGTIAFAKDGEIWAFNGSSAKQITNLAGAADPDWSPDGTSLAFDKQDKNSADLYVMSYPGGSMKALSNNSNSRVVENNFWEMQPAWSPDGSTLAYVSDRGRLKSGTLDPAAWRITLSGGTRTQLNNPSQYAGGIDFPRWRPGHPNELIYTSWTYDAQTLEAYGQLVLQDTQSNRTVSLTPANESSFHASWSPDGSTIVYVKRQQGRDDLWTMAVPDLPATTRAPTPTATVSVEAPRQLLQGRMAHPAWSPDGDAIAYIGLKDGSLDLFVQPLTAELTPDGQPKQLTTNAHLEGASSISWMK